MLKVASYNIRKAIGTDRRRRPERILEVLEELNADIVALQEADRRFGMRHAVLPDWMLESHGQWRAVILAARPESMGWHGNALLVRRDMRVLSADALHLPCLEPRGAVSALVQAGDTMVRVVGMHLDLSGLWRRRQAGAILHHLAQEENRHPASGTVLMGDMNQWRERRGPLRDFHGTMAEVPCGPSFHARRPVASLDRILHAGQLDLVDCGVHTSALARTASDHLPVWAQFTLPG
jgi:endonuclease/exonuclease/phosphatase family metal-dependent hydrolase